MTLALLLRVAGASLVVLALLHAAFWRMLDWGLESKRLSPLNARVFSAHTFFVAFVLLGLGLISLARPELLLARGELARLLLIGVVTFWVARLLMQPFVFDSVMRAGWTRSPIVRIGANLVWGAYVLVYGAALAHQLAPASGWIPSPPLDLQSPLTWLRLGIGSVWLLFGLVFKVLGAAPRHGRIVARIVGQDRARLVLGVVAAAEIGIGLWMLVGRALVPCMVVQTLLLVSMNVLELRRARDLLLWPAGMVCANVVLLALGWTVALAGPGH